MNKKNSINKKALLVIDIQEDATGIASKKPYENSKKLINNVNFVIECSKKQGIIVIYIKHEVKNNLLNKIIMRNRFIEGTHGSEIDSRIKIVSENIYSKSKGNAFSNDNLDKDLKKNQINELYIVGLDAAACIYKTAIGSINKGYRAVVLKDAIATSNMKKLPKILEKYRRKGILLTSVQKYKQTTG